LHAAEAGLRPRPERRGLKIEQLILHLIGDYLTQSDWMAQNKTERSWPAFCHAAVYSLPFLLLTGVSYHGLTMWYVIFITHYVIDRFRLARYVVWAKNWIAPKSHWIMQTKGEPMVFDQGLTRNIPWKYCTKTGYPPGRPDWLAVWLLIIADNTLHLAINYATLRWL
jgi:hypothetical protein